MPENDKVKTPTEQEELKNNFNRTIILTGLLPLFRSLKITLILVEQFSSHVSGTYRIVSMQKPINESLWQQRIFFLFFEIQQQQKEIRVSGNHSDNPSYPTYFHFGRKDGVRAQQIFLEVYGGSAQQT